VDFAFFVVKKDWEVGRKDEKDEKDEKGRGGTRLGDGAPRAKLGKGADGAGRARGGRLGAGRKGAGG
jgi:hypothetical protein